jgi:hypothetical protein
MFAIAAGLHDLSVTRIKPSFRDVVPKLAAREPFAQLLQAGDRDPHGQEDRQTTPQTGFGLGSQSSLVMTEKVLRGRRIAIHEAVGGPTAVHGSLPRTI